MFVNAWLLNAPNNNSRPRIELAEYGVKMSGHRHRSCRPRLFTRNARPSRLMEYPYMAEQIDRRNLSYYYGTVGNAPPVRFVCLVSTSTEVTKSPTIRFVDSIDRSIPFQPHGRRLIPSEIHFSTELRHAANFTDDLRFPRRRMLLEN